MSLDVSDSDQPESLPVSEWTGEMSAAWAERNLSAHVAEAFRGEVALWESISDVDTPVVLIIKITFLTADQEIDGEALAELGRIGSPDQMKECGLTTVGMQLKLRKLLNRLCANGMVPTQ